MKKIIVAIDGPAGSGKSTAAKLLAKRIKIPYIDTGAMYRAVTYKVMSDGVDFNDKKALVATAKKAKINFRGNDPLHQQVYLEDKNITKLIRRPSLTKNVFYLAQLAPVRRALVYKQRIMGKTRGAVMEGRDIGTVVFPKAHYKFYFEADAGERAKRRYRELRQAGHQTSLEIVHQDILRRDETDLKRKEGPLRMAKDAILIDTTRLTIEETVDRIAALIHPNTLKGLKLGKRRE